MLETHQASPSFVKEDNPFLLKNGAKKHPRLSHDFYIGRLEDLRKKAYFSKLPQRKDRFELVFLTEGKAVFCKGLGTYTLRKHTFYFLPAHQISSCAYLSEDAEGFVCQFNPAIFSSLFPHRPFYEDFDFWQSTDETLLTLNPTQIQPLIHILHRLENEWLAVKDFQSNLFVAYLFTLFTELKVIKKRTPYIHKNASIRVTDSYKSLLMQHICQINKVATYAAMLSITPDHLNKCVKAATGKTSQELLADMLILEAQVLLKQTSLTIGEIALQFSETSPSDFSRFFKHKTRLSPKQYRLLADESC